MNKAIPALDFKNGNHAHINDGNSLDLSNRGSVVACVKMDQFQILGGIINKGDQNISIGQSYALFLLTGPRFVFEIGNGIQIGVQSNTIIQPNFCYHVVGTWNSTKLCIYINGTLDNCITNNYGSTPITSSVINIGSVSSDGSYPFGGLISRVEIWNKSLTASEIAVQITQSFQTSLSNPNLVAYYPFNEITGNNNIYDQSGNGNNGILIGVPLPTRTTLICGSKILCCDPHFTGLDGSKYDVKIKEDGLYNIVSRCGIIVNQMFYQDRYTHSAWKNRRQ